MIVEEEQCVVVYLSREVAFPDLKVPEANHYT